MVNQTGKPIIMSNHRFYKAIILLSVLSFISCTEQGIKLVHNLDQFNEAVASAIPGDVITLADGVWKDVDLVFEGEGTQNKPITLTVQTKGKVSLEGLSNLKLAGNYLVVEGLVFKNGHTPTNSVISFRKNRTELANNSRLTQCVIDNYNNPGRNVQDYWISIYGKNNRIDHNHIAGKKNLGVTMIVGLDTEESVANNHQIDHNYFGPRPTFGSNGGETLRIGTSHHAMENSNTLVESNYFDRCNGEHEIISNKSCQNTFKYNTFYECTGTLTMRHGNETLVDGNVFIGNNKPSTGGVRVINEKQTVINNYHYGLTGYRFRGAFVMMNGVPNSPANRYVQVTDSKVSNNVFVDSDHIQLCAGSDDERSAVPLRSELTNNVFYHSSKENLFTIYDDVSGIKFSDNLINSQMSTSIDSGFERVSMELEKDTNGFLIPKSDQFSSQFSISDQIATKDNTGVSWYSKAIEKKGLNSGELIKVAPGINSLSDAVQNSSAGAILELESNKEYKLTKAVEINHPITIRSSGAQKAIVLFERMKAFEILNGGSLSLENIKFDGAISPDYAGNSVVSTSSSPMIENYKLFIDKCEFINLKVNHSFDVIRVSKNTFADTISIKNSIFKDITGHIVALDKETDDIGVYNVEYLIMNNNIFSNVQGAALRLYRGGTDESTFGPFLEMQHNVFDRVGFGKKNKYKSALSLYGVQVNDISNNIFNETAGIQMHLVVGEPIVTILNNNYYKSGKIWITGDQKYRLENLYDIDPAFDESFRLPKNSPLRTMGMNGEALGLINN